MSDQGDGSSALKQERARVTRAAIVESAARVFCEVGYAEATLARIRQQTKLTNGAFYFHFPSREAVAEAVIAAYEAVVASLVEDARRHDGSALESLLILSKDLIVAIEADVHVRAGLVLTTQASTLTVASRSPYLQWIEAVQDVLVRAVAEGDVRDDIDVRDLARYLVSAFTGTQLVAGALEERVGLRDAVGSGWRFVLPAMLPPSQAARVGAQVDAVFLHTGSGAQARR